jgi:hypothetical protein
MKEQFRSPTAPSLCPCLCFGGRVESGRLGPRRSPACRRARSTGACSRPAPGPTAPRRSRPTHQALRRLSVTSTSSEYRARTGGAAGAISVLSSVRQSGHGVKARRAGQRHQSKPPISPWAAHPAILDHCIEPPDLESESCIGPSRPVAASGRNGTLKFRGVPLSLPPPSGVRTGPPILTIATRTTAVHHSCTRARRKAVRSRRAANCASTA